MFSVCIKCDVPSGHQAHHSAIETFRTVCTEAGSELFSVCIKYDGPEGLACNLVKACMTCCTEMHVACRACAGRLTVGCQEPPDGQTPCQIMHPEMQLQQVPNEHDSIKELKAFKILLSKSKPSCKGMLARSCMSGNVNLLQILLNTS